MDAGGAGVEHRPGHRPPEGSDGAQEPCHPTWGTISINDVYTSSRSGQRHFTVHALGRARAGPCTRFAWYSRRNGQAAAPVAAGSARRPGGADIVFVGRPADGVGSRLGGPGIISLEIDDAVAGGGWIRWSLSSAPQSLAAGVTEGMTVRVVIR